MESRVISELILHLGRVASGDGAVHGLSSGQWAALRYFARANRFSRTPSAFAAFQGTTRGTASQIIKSLVAKNYLTQTRSKDDGRSVSIDLTDKAKAVIDDDPLEVLVRAADDLPLGMRAGFGGTLQRMLCSVAAEAEKPQFGTCRNCSHFRDADCCQAKSHECGFLSEVLDEAELDALCIRFHTGKDPSGSAVPHTEASS